MTKPTIAVIDDAREQADNICGFLQQGLDAAGRSDQVHVDRLFDHEHEDDSIHPALDSIRNRRDPDNEDPFLDRKQLSCIEGADVVIVDADLRDMGESEGILNGDVLAQALRLYTDATTIVVVNRDPVRRFNLNPTAETELFADLHLDMQDLAIPWLWADVATGYAPWNWPNLLQNGLGVKHCVNEVKGNEGQPLASFLGFETADVDLLPGEATRLAIDIQSPQHSVESIWASMLPKREQSEVTRERMASTVVPLIRNWLRGPCLATGEVVVDIPHLITRCPRLFTGNHDDSGDLASLVRRSEFDGQLESEITPHLVSGGGWFDRPVANAASLFADKNIPDVGEPWAVPRMSFRFAEDCSSFVQADDARPFQSEGRFRTRYLSKTGTIHQEDIEFTPARRLAA